LTEFDAVFNHHGLNLYASLFHEIKLELFTRMAATINDKIAIRPQTVSSPCQHARAISDSHLRQFTCMDVQQSPPTSRSTNVDLSLANTIQTAATTMPVSSAVHYTNGTGTVSVPFNFLEVFI